MSDPRRRFVSRSGEGTPYGLVTGMIAFLATTGIFAATPMVTFKIDQDRVIAVPGMDSPLVEPHLSINPKDPNNLIAGQ